MTEEQQPSSMQLDDQANAEAQQTNQLAIDVGLNRPATVLLSYAHEDKASVKELQLRLKARGVRSWRDEDDLLAGGLFEQDIVQAIEHEVDAMALYVTPDSLQSDFLWKKEIPAALRRHQRDPHFHIVPILQGVSFVQLQQACRKRNVGDLSRFNGISLTEGVSSGDWEEQNKKWNDAARRILQAALTLRLRRIQAGHDYEAWLALKTFPFKSLTTSLDLDLNWLDLVYEKERQPTLQEWERILLPALLDVKRFLSEKVPSHRLHCFVKGMFPAALALGFIFRESTGFTLLLEREKPRETWSTEIEPSEQEPLQVDWNHHESGDAQTAVVALTTSRPIKDAVDDALSSHSLRPAYHIGLEVAELSRESVRDAAHAQALARQTSRIFQDLCGRHRVTHIHLFMAVPVELAVLIGYQLNALCPITLYEFSEWTYKPIGIIR